MQDIYLVITGFLCPLGDVTELLAADAAENIT